MNKYVNIIPAHNINIPLLYLAPAKSEVGDYVKISIKSKEYYGIIIETITDNVNIQENKIKNIIQKFEIPKMKQSLIAFIIKMSKYNMCNMGNVLKLTIGAQLSEPHFYEVVKERSTKKHSKTEKKVISLLDQNEAILLDEITYKCKLKSNSLEKLIQSGVIIGTQYNRQIQIKDNISLSSIQDKAFHQLDSKKPILLDGITGSGKTEVYIKYICKILNQDNNNQALIMLPEIELATHLLERFIDYIGEKNVVSWHSKLTKAQKKINWQKIVSGATKLVVGARSAVVLPFKCLKIIVVDEEHDSSYKQWESISYNARDMAVLRASIEKIPIILSSATPSLETMYNVYLNKFDKVILSSRFKNISLPEVNIIDMKNQNSIISEKLHNAIEKRLQQNEQVLIFLNRRGYAPIKICKKCGYKIKCKNCSVCLTTYKQLNAMICNYCGYKIPQQLSCCPECSSELTNYGIGVEKIHEIIKNLFPDKRIAIISSDSYQAKKTVKLILKNEIDIIIGTQMIAKGYHFPQLTLVGVIDADLGLDLVELRASERNYQILHQISGRAGREKNGNVMIQTYIPQHPIMQALKTQNRNLFYSTELETRQNAGMPPFKMLASIIISHKSNNKCIEISNIVAKNITQDKKIKVLGPSPSPIHQLYSKYRYRFLVIGEKGFGIQKYIKEWIPKSFSNNIKIDIDPMNFM